MKNKTKLKIIAAVIAINGIAAYGLFNNSTMANLKNAGGATTAHIQLSETASPTQLATTPVVVATARAVAAVEGAVAATAKAVQAVTNALGRNTNPQSMYPTQFSTGADYQQFLLSKLD